MVVRAVDGDVLILVLVERSHQRFEVGLAADFTHVLGREVRVHARTVPVDVLTERLAVPVYIDSVLLAETGEEGSGHPHLVGSGPRALAADLEFPLPRGDFGVDAFVVDSGSNAKVQVGVDNLAGDAAHVFVTDAGVILALRRRGARARRGPA